MTTMAIKASKTETPISIKTPGVHHAALRVSDFNRAKQFYTEILGFDIILEQPNLFIFLAGKTAIAIRGPEKETPNGDSFNPFRVGLDHLALACEDESELNRVAGELDKANVWNTGVKTDETLNKKYVAFKDPDRISWEYYMV
jgi:glyoxylase I family protein